MGKIFKLCPKIVTDRVQSMLRAHHPELAIMMPRIDCIFAQSTGDESAVSLGGYPCLAVVKIISLKERTAGRGDAEILIDFEAYEDLTDAQKDALIDHELEHLQLKVDERGTPKVDALKRPLFTMKKHDHQFGWFDSIVKRHGANSIESIQAQEWQSRVGQLYLAAEFVPDEAVARPRR
jgi:hypothetical protein